MKRAPVKEAEKGDDWRAQVGQRNDSGLSLDLGCAREQGRGREAKTPEQIPARGWQDILWRVLWSISADRILSTSGGVSQRSSIRAATAFVALGEQTDTLGRSALEKQHPVSARDQFERASMYYRAAEYYDDPVTDTSRAHGVMSRDLFLEAVRLMPWTAEVLHIPFQHAWLPGYFMRPAPPDARPRKTIIVLTGSTERRKNSISNRGGRP